MNIYLKNDDGYLRLHYASKYASGSYPIQSIDDLIKSIEDTCGKGSYSFYHKPSDYPKGYPKAIKYEDYKLYPNLPRITYWQQGIKTNLIETARNVAREVWGNIPELEIGYLEHVLQTYVD